MAGIESSANITSVTPSAITSVSTGAEPWPRVSRAATRVPIPGAGSCAAMSSAARVAIPVAGSRAAAPSAARVAIPVAGSRAAAPAATGVLPPVPRRSPPLAGDPRGEGPAGGGRRAAHCPGRSPGPGTAPGALGRGIKKESGEQELQPAESVQCRRAESDDDAAQHHGDTDAGQYHAAVQLGRYPGPADQDDEDQQVIQGKAVLGQPAGEELARGRAARGSGEP